MNILCTICDDLLNEDGDNTIFVTLCGHIFHSLCLFEWLDRSSTCPQCRSIVNTNSLTRLFLTFASEKPEDETVKQLQSCLDNQEQLYRQQLEDLKSQKALLNKMKRKNEAQKQNIVDLKKELEGLRERCILIETHSRVVSADLHWANEDIKHKKSIIADLQVKNKEVMTENETLKIKNKDLKTENEELEVKNEDLMTVNEALKIKNEYLMTENETLKIKNQNVKTENVSLKIKEKNLKKENQILEMNAQILSRKLHLANEKKTQESVVVDLENKNKDLVAKTETLKKTIETLNGKVHEVGENLRQKEWVISDLVAQLKCEESKDEELTKRIDKLRSSTQTPICELLDQTCDEPEGPKEDIQNEREHEISNDSEQEQTVTDDPNVSVSIDTPALGDITTSEESSPVTEIDLLYNEIKNRLTFARTAK